MLVLSRSRGQAIVIGGGIVVDIVSICRGRVQIGITAPKNVSIHREEIQQRIDESPRAPKTQIKRFSKTVSTSRRTVEMHVTPGLAAALTRARFARGNSDGIAVGG
jgi:carbon storage regulator